MDFSKQISPEVVPTLIEIITAGNKVVGFDTFENRKTSPNQERIANRCDSATIEAERQLEIITDLSVSGRRHSVSISMPSSPTQFHLKNTKNLVFREETTNLPSTPKIDIPKKARFHSQPIQPGSINCHQKNPTIDRLKDKSYDSFKTWSGKVERQLSNLRGKPRKDDLEENSLLIKDIENLPVDRYFDALEGPELDTLKVYVSALKHLPTISTSPFFR